MKNTSYRARTLACVLLATTAYCGLTAPAHAQTAGSGAPPKYDNADENGVDLVTGKISLSIDEASIGDDNGGLSFTEFWAQDAGWVDNWSGGMYDRTVGSQTITHVQLGDISDTFIKSGTAYVSEKANGGTLTTAADGNYLYTASDGTRITFLNSGAERFSYTCPGADTSKCNIPLSITRPDGMTVKLSWDRAEVCRDLPGEPCASTTAYYRFAGATSSAGFLFTVSYAIADAGGAAPTSGWYRRSGIQFSNLISSCGTSCPSVSYAGSGPGLNVITDALGRETRVSTGSYGPTAVRRPGSTTDTTTIAYAADGTVSSVTRDGVTTGYSRVVSGNVATTTITNALNHTRVVTSDLSLGRVTSIRDELGRTTSSQHDANGRPTRITAPEGNSVQYSYDPRGNVTETRAVAKPGSGLPDLVSSAVYPQSCDNRKICNKPSSATDARGNITDFSYDPTHGGLTSVTAPAPSQGAIRPQTRISYAPTPSPLADYPAVWLPTATSACQTQTSCAGSADEVRSSISYGANLLRTGVSSGSGDGSLTATQAMSYDAAGNLLTVDGPLAGTADTVRYRYNAVRELTGAISPDPDGGGPLKHRAQRMTYGAYGQAITAETGTVFSQSDADWANFASLEAVETGYDGNARPVTQKLLASSTTYALTHTSYDALGRPECTAQRMNPNAFGSLPASACSLGAEGSFGPDRIARTVYNEAGEVTQVRTAVGTPLEAPEASSTFRPNGGVETLTDAENNRTTYEYDGHGRLSRTYFPSPTKGSGTSNFADYEQQGYDPNGNVTSFKNRAGETTVFKFDNLNRLEVKDLRFGEGDAFYSYDLLGRLIEARQNTIISFTYDALGRKLSETGVGGTIQSTYDLAGRRTMITHPGGFQLWHEYLVTGEVSLINGPGQHWFYYDNLGRRTWLTRSNGTSTSYSYDPVSRLSQLKHDLTGTTHDVTLSFSYNPASQIVSTSRSNDAFAFTGHANGTTSESPNGLNQIVSQGGKAITFDAKGNVTSDPATGYTFGYSSENLLTTVKGPGWTGALRYDPLMRLVAAGAGNSTWVANDGEDRIAEYNEAGERTLLIVHGPGINEPLLTYDGVNGHRFLYPDERGSIIAGADFRGNVDKVYGYDEYGTIAAPQHNRFEFTGHVYESMSQLLYARGRFYNPKLGRFMQPDPIGHGDGMNMYAYVKGDPVNFTDPWGLERQCGTFNIGGSREFTADGGVIVTARFAVLCWDDGRGGGGGRGEGGGGGGGGPGDASQPAPPKPSPLRDTVRSVRCAVGRAGIVVEKGGAQTAEFGANLTITGAVTAIGGALFGNPIVAGVGTTMVSSGLVFAGGGGTFAFLGSGMRAVGGDYQNFVTRGISRFVGGRLPATQEIRSASRNQANQLGTSPQNQIPTCRK